MKDKLEVGMYVRTKDGKIAKFIKYDEEDKEELVTDYYEYSTIWIKDVAKASYNIIDLIKPKDIILGNDGKLYQCWKVYKDYVFTYSKNKQGLTITLVDYQIDRVMCYEQFESMSYKLGDDK